MVAGANQSWFHLYEVVQPPAVDMDDSDAADGVALVGRRHSPGAVHADGNNGRVLGSAGAAGVLPTPRRCTGAIFPCCCQSPSALGKLFEQEGAHSLCYLGRSLMSDHGRLVVQACAGCSSDVGWWSGLAALLANVGAYYGQFNDAVQAALKDGLKPLEKQLQVCAVQ